MQFAAHVIDGSGVGGAIGIPTINLGLDDVPGELEEGIYAAWVGIDGETYPAAVHYGPRPAHGLGPSFEAHLIDATIPSPPQILSVDIIKRLRDIQDFESENELAQQIREDILEVRAILIPDTLPSDETE